MRCLREHSLKHATNVRVGENDENAVDGVEDPNHLRPCHASLRFLTPYSDHIASLKIKKLFRQCFEDLELQLAWKVRKNSMRILYRYNFI